jgi:hypothetical protein
LFSCPDDVESCCCPEYYTYTAEKSSGQGEHEECTGVDIEGFF